MLTNSSNRLRVARIATLAFFVSTLCIFGLGSTLYGGVIAGSRHDLSTGTSPYVCVFCHTPHNANPDVDGPLWNRSLSTDPFTLYSSPTMETTPGQPNPVSAMCLGCHDGVNASVAVNGVLVSTKHDLVSYLGESPDMSSYPECERCHPNFYGGIPKLSLGTDLGNDHPISMPYPASAKFNLPPDAQNGWGKGSARLYEGDVECVTCHSVHDPDIPPFLNMSNDNSALCMTCHNK